MAEDTYTLWVPEHFIGGHPALDLANAVFDRRAPARDNELLKSARDVGHWLHSTGLADGAEADAVASIADAALVERVREIREAIFAVFDALVAGRAPGADALGLLLRRAAEGLAAEPAGLNDTRLSLSDRQWREPDAVAGMLALLGVEAFFTLPRDRLGSCPRCGWLYVDTSRGGRRRWCSMRTCGNREKAVRHRVG